MSFLFFIGKMVALYTTFLEFHLTPTGHSSRQRLHVPLKLLVMVDLLIKFHLNNGVRLLSFNPQKHLDRAVWFLKEGLEKECLWL